MNISEVQVRCISPFIDVYAEFLCLGMQLDADKRSLNVSHIGNVLDLHFQGQIFGNTRFLPLFHSDIIETWVLACTMVAKEHCIVKISSQIVQALDFIFKVIVVHISCENIS